MIFLDNNQSLFLQVFDIKEVLLLGFYPASEMASFVADMNKEHQQVFF